ncbi:MAG: hypothetical protein RL519_771 [Pseudomonadota bacterium]|jgi:NADP-dependent 3-hydroxy acid dehydrogenase YdfG
MSSGSKTCLITGVGPGTGAALAERFAAGGYRVAMLARSAERLAGLEARIEGAQGFVCDVADSEALAGTYAEVTAAMGAPDMVIHNAVRGTRGDYLAVDPADLERNFQINVMALLHLARLAVPAMVARGGGVVLATGNTAAYRGKAHFAAFAPTKAAQRILIETIARKSGPDGIHAALIAIDAVIDVPWTREAFADKSDDFFSKPGDIAEVCWQVAHQPRSAWCSEVMIRPFGETW